MPRPLTNKKIFFRMLLLGLLLALAACATSQSRILNDCIIIKATSKDTFSSLAGQYLGDPEKAWLIAEFNATTTLSSGQELIIPLFPYNKGGLQANGYQTVPILAYNNFSKHSSGNIIVSEPAFDAQMKYLKENGYHVVPLKQFLDFLDYKTQLPKKSVVITIDVGWRSVYDIAFPILKKYDFPATLFLYIDFIGGSKALSWKQVKELSDQGLDIQCQTRTHRNLTTPKEEEAFNSYFQSLEMEISYPKMEISQKLNKTCDCLAYPYGKTNELIIAMLKKHGYRAAFTVRRDANPFFVDRYKIQRSVIYGKYDIEKFKKNLTVFHKIKLK